MKAIVKFIGWVLMTLFFAFVATTFYENSGNELPEGISTYRDVFQSGLESFLSSWMFYVVFVVGWFAVSYQLGKKSGWRMLAVDYAESGLESSPDFSTASGYVGSIPYQGSLRVGAHTLGLALRVFLLFRFGNPNLNIPWTAIESVSVRKSASPPGKSSFLDRLSTKISNARYAHICLARHPEQTLIIPWNENLRAGIPTSVTLIIEDE